MSINLQHRPFGWGHPYEQDADERVPRHPHVGQSIKLQAVSSPSGAVRRLWWRWCETGSEWIELEADCQLDEESGKDRWVAEIPAQSNATVLSYELLAETQTGEILSGGEFVVDIPEWMMPTQIEKIWAENGALKVAFGFGSSSLNVEYDYCLGENDRLINNYGRAGSVETPKSGQGEWVCRQVEGVLEIWENDGLALLIDNDRLTVSLKRDSDALLEETASFELLVNTEGQIHAIRRTFSVEEDEAFVGLGERFNALNQHGESLDTRVFEQWRVQGKRTYIPIPFFLSSKGYGYFENASRKAQFDFSSGCDGKLVITQETGADFKGQTVIFTNPVWETNVRAFVEMNAKPEMPPVWAFGLWMSSNEWYNQAEVNRQVQLMKEHEIPTTVLVLEAWSDEANFYIWNDAQYETKPSSERLTLSDFTYPPDGLWPNPKQMTDDLHREGMKLILWQIPVLKYLNQNFIEQNGENPQHDLDEAHMIENGYCVQKPDGNPYRVPPIWFANSLVLDVTNQEAAEWWLSKRRYLLEEMGVDGFKTDGGEHLWGYEPQFADGRTNAEIWNEYPRLYQQHYYDYSRRYGGEDTVLFSRAGYTGSQSAPLHWAGDQISTWEAFRAVLFAGQSLGVSGIPFWGWDIGGFSGPIPSAELYLRSTAVAAFAPIMQYHSEYNDHKPISIDRTPWNIQEQTGDDRVIPAFRKFANLRMNLLPYLYSEAFYASQTGQAMFGSPFIRFQDHKFMQFPTQFLCGRYLLVAPVVEPGMTEWSVYLPEGRWVDFWDGTVYEGKQSITQEVGLDTVPVFVREGALLPFNLNGDLKFGSHMSNDLGCYDTLTLVQFGNTDPAFEYHWHDYITKRIYSLTTGKDWQTVCQPLLGKVNQVVSINK